MTAISVIFILLSKNHRICDDLYYYESSEQGVEALFDRRSDAGETTNRIEEHPEVAEEVRQKHHARVREVGEGRQRVGA